MDEAQEYVNKLKGNILEKKLWRVKFNNTRFERIKHIIYDFRLEEITTHKERLQLHELVTSDTKSMFHLLTILCLRVLINT